METRSKRKQRNKSPRRPSKDNNSILHVRIVLKRLTNDELVRYGVSETKSTNHCLLSKK